MNFEPLEALFEFPIEDVVPVPPAPQMRPIELPRDDEGHNWYIWDMALESDAQIVDDGVIAPPRIPEPEDHYENLMIQQLLDTVKAATEIVQYLRQDVRNGLRNDLDSAAIDVCQEMRNRLAIELIDTVSRALAHREGDTTYSNQVLLAILMERFLDGHAEDGDVQVLNAIVRSIIV
ncbi:uncharacterized protein FOMMEDRAFT_156254 [Fomitiporia mediterranea MF3/22]|uniref:uncharacterized protein n=1 Tax=Fomitiporia mediterranea (strain MF3/22) TaxID=694068 RepID=UPI0004407429|nr:uncharacterized protein FOMMEDRAFT_156254 [Fomitiporia mediterranea MF3/22]EJD02891.1 hypothetical protein FOMMEDRAFT_156254 [Fomitiporia mediterranea MF3/22]